MQSALRLGAFVGALMALAVATPAATTANKLEWRRGRTTVTRTSRPAASQPVIRAHAPQSRVDLKVRQAAFEDDGGPEFSPDNEGAAQFRSVIVERGEPVNSIRSAQFPSSQPDPAGAPGTSGATEPDTELGEELRSPFTEAPTELPPFEEPPQGLETTQPPAEETLQLEQNQRQPIMPPSTEFQPSVPPRGRETTPPLPDNVPTPSVDTIEAEREKAQEACSQGFEDLQDKTIGKLDLTIRVTGTEGSDYPFECQIEGGLHEGRCWQQTTYLWKASALCHKPLYFEDEQLERYGHSFPPCFQPFVSGAHFFCTLPILPYCMGVEPPCECIYALGHYRPGNCAPYMCNPIPLSPRGALFQAGAAWGTAAILP